MASSAAQPSCATPMAQRARCRWSDRPKASRPKGSCIWKIVRSYSPTFIDPSLGRRRTLKMHIRIKARGLPDWRSSLAWFFLMRCPWLSYESFFRGARLSFPDFTRHLQYVDLQTVFPWPFQESYAHAQPLSLSPFHWWEMYRTLLVWVRSSHSLIRKVMDDKNKKTPWRGWGLF